MSVSRLIRAPGWRLWRFVCSCVYCTSETEKLSWSFATTVSEMPSTQTGPFTAMYFR